MFSDLKNATLNSVLETMVDGVIIIDESGNIQLYNSACETIFGYSFAEVSGKNVKILMPHPDRGHHDDYIANYQKTGTAKIIGIGRQVSGRRKNGEIFPMYLSVGENNIAGETGYVGIIRDVTTETENLKKYKLLQQEFFHLSRIAAMNELGTAIAHELNQPLAAIMNYIQAAKINLESSEPLQKSRLQDMMKKSADQVERASKTLASLRRFIQTGDLDKELFDLSDVINTSIDLAGIGLETKKVTLTCEISKDLPKVFGSDVQIQQVLVNLIRNAFEAVHNEDKREILITAMANNAKEVKVGVTDTGIGLSEQAMNTLFQAFSSDKNGGLGVGLSISRSIISNHSGRLWAENNDSGGTGFYFTLPISAE